MLQDQSSATTASPFSQALTLFGDLREVIGIDIGILPIAHGDCPVGLRIHVATPADVLRIHNAQHLPGDINGVRLMLMPTQYKTISATPTTAQPANVKYSIQLDGLGQLLNQIMAKQHPLAGRIHQLIATSGNKGQVIAPSVMSAGNDIIQTLEELEESIKCTPNAPAPILCYRIGHLTDSHPIELTIANAEGQSTQKFTVDGCGVYKHNTNRTDRFIEGFRVIPAP